MLHAASHAFILAAGFAAAWFTVSELHRCAPRILSALMGRGGWQ